IVMIMPALEERFSRLTQGLAAKAQSFSKKQPQEGFRGGFCLGLLIGAVWTPCAGGLIAAVLLQVLQSKTDFAAALQIASFSVGVGVPMLAIALTGKVLVQKLNKYAVAIRRGMGMILVAFATLGLLNINIGALTTRYLPSETSPVTAKAG